MSFGQLHELHRNKIDNTFHLFDCNKDEHLNYGELREAMIILGCYTPKGELLDTFCTRATLRPIYVSRGAKPPYQIMMLLVGLSQYRELAAQRMLMQDPRDHTTVDLLDTLHEGTMTVEDVQKVSQKLGVTIGFQQFHGDVDDGSLEVDVDFESFV